MFSTIADKLWGTQMGDNNLEFESPGKSTVCDETEQQGTPKRYTGPITCSLWIVDGNDAQEAMDGANVEFGETKLIFQPSGSDSAKKHEFKYSELIHFHEEQQDIYQWIVKKNSENLCEFGAAFVNIPCGVEFGMRLRPKLREGAAVLAKQKVEFHEYCYTTKTWVVKEKDACLSILQRQSDSEGYLVLSKMDEDEIDNDCVFSEINISHEEYIFPQPDVQQLTWWGASVTVPESGEERRQMVCAKFLRGDAEMNTVLKVFEEVLQKGEKDKDVEMYDAEMFETEVDSQVKCDFLNDEGEKEEQEVCDNFQNISKDSTRQVVAKSPKSKVHKLMFNGRSRTFVVRGSLVPSKAGNVEMQVMKFDKGEEEVVGTVDGSKLQYKNTLLCPNRALLHDRESKVLFTDESCGKEIYYMDLEKETVVQKWEAGDGLTVQNMMETKRDQEDSTYICSNPKSLFKMDTRLTPKEGKSNRTTTLQYATNVNFTAGATDCDGHILMGSKSGDLRLYDGEENKEGKFKKAKTHLQGLGDPLLHVTVTNDGGWILGTSAKYLVLYPVKIKGDNKNGFTKSLGKAKPPPIVLKPTMDDMVKYRLKDVHFTKAEFNKEETAIVTSTGNLAIVWDFAKTVKNPAEKNYVIRTVDDYIKDVNFVKANGHDSILMATPCGVTLKPIIQ